MSAQVNRQYKIFLLKLVALLSLVRWYNVLLLVLAQYLAAFFVMRPLSDWRVNVLDYRLHLIIISSALVISAGFIINSFYDREKDLINRPQQTLFERILSQRAAFLIAFAFNLLAITLAYAVSWRAALFYAAFGSSLWYYSHKLKKLTFIGDLAAAILAIAPFFGIFFYFGEVHWDLIFYVSFMLFIILSRELVKDIETVKGDVIIGYGTIPAKIGVRKTKAIILFINFFSFIPAFLLYHIFSLPVLLFLVSCLMGITITNLYLIWDDDEKRVLRVNTIYKFFIVASVLSLVLFAL